MVGFPSIEQARRALGVAPAPASLAALAREAQIAVRPYTAFFAKATLPVGRG